MNKLTAKQEKFCQCIVSGMTQADAYREAYGQKRLSQKVLWIRASEVAANSKVLVRIAELRKPVAEKAQITLASHLEDLARLRNLAVQKDQIAAAITAEIARGKAAGVHVEKSQISVDNIKPFVIVRYGADDKTK
jgi:phage terminase small subunit